MNLSQIRFQGLQPCELQYKCHESFSKPLFNNSIHSVDQTLTSTDSDHLNLRIKPLDTLTVIENFKLKKTQSNLFFSFRTQRTKFIFQFKKRLVEEIEFAFLKNRYACQTTDSTTTLMDKLTKWRTKEFLK